MKASYDLNLRMKAGEKNELARMETNRDGEPRHVAPHADSFNEARERLISTDYRSEDVHRVAAPAEVQRLVDYGPFATARIEKAHVQDS